MLASRHHAGDAAWLSASRKFIAIQTLDKVVGFEYGRCYGAGMIRTEVARALPWPHVSYREDHRMYEAAREHPAFRARLREADDLTYVHRRHDTNASAAHRESMWQGVLPLQLAGADALAAAARVRELLHEAHEQYLEPADEAPVDGEAAAADAREKAEVGKGMVENAPAMDATAVAVS